MLNVAGLWNFYWDASTIKLWRPDTGVIISTLEGHTSAINSLTFSPNGEILGGGIGTVTKQAIFKQTNYKKFLESVAL